MNPKKKQKKTKKKVKPAPRTIACLGPAGSYSHQAVLRTFGAKAACVFTRSFAEIFETVSTEEASLGLVPIENSTEGGVNAVHDQLVHTDLLIAGESYLKIQNGLYTAPGVKNIKRIYSHPQPFGQCRKWLLTHYPDAEQIVASSTSEAARLAKKDKCSAALTGALAGRLAGLKVLKQNANDIADNSTRFLILSKEPAPLGKRNKTSLIFSVIHEVGALSAILAIFARHGLNLQKIESRPSPHKAWEYLFFVDISAHFRQNIFKQALEKIRKKTLWLKILGSYPTHG